MPLLQNIQQKRFAPTRIDLGIARRPSRNRR
jgi:hypothetical protein